MKKKIIVLFFLILTLNSCNKKQTAKTKKDIAFVHPRTITTKDAIANIRKKVKKPEYQKIVKQIKDNKLHLETDTTKKKIYYKLINVAYYNAFLYLFTGEDHYAQKSYHEVSLKSYKVESL